MDPPKFSECGEYTLRMVSPFVFFRGELTILHELRVLLPVSLEIMHKYAGRA
jgi:hypothetical protein